MRLLPGSEPASGPDAEGAWIRRTAGGDALAFERLFRAYRAPLFRYLYRMTRSRETAEELTGDVMVAIWRGASTYRGEARPSTWIFGIAHYKALNALRRRRQPAVDIEAMRDLAGGDDPAAGAERRGLQERIQQALAHLSADHREVVHLTFYQGLSCAEIAAVVGCPVNTVKTRMFHARRRLHDLLGEASP